MFGAAAGRRLARVPRRNLSSLLVRSRAVVLARRSYYSQPKPTFTMEQMEEWVKGKKPKHVLGQRGRKHRLNEDEQRQNSAARRTGYLSLGNTSTPGLVDLYLRYCWAVGRPYLAMNKHGDRLIVDLTPGAPRP